RGGGWGSLSGAARWVLSNSLEPELELLRDRGLRSAVLWGVGDTLLPKWIGERAAELLGGSFEAVTVGDGWPERRPSDHDWPPRAARAHPAAEPPRVHAGMAEERGTSGGPADLPPAAAGPLRRGPRQGAAPADVSHLQLVLACRRVRHREHPDRGTRPPRLEP